MNNDSELSNLYELFKNKDYKECEEFCVKQRDFIIMNLPKTFETRDFEYIKWIWEVLNIKIINNGMWKNKLMYFYRISSENSEIADWVIELSKQYLNIDIKEYVVVFDFKMKLYKHQKNNIEKIFKANHEIIKENINYILLETVNKIHKKYDLLSFSLLIDFIKENYIKINIHIDDEMIFIRFCSDGDFELAKWLWDFSVKLKSPINIHAQNERAFSNCCTNGHLDIAKWLWDLSKEINSLINIHVSNYIDDYEEKDKIFIYTCSGGHLETTQWLWKISNEICKPFDIHTYNDYAFNMTMWSNLETLKWLWNLSKEIGSPIDICNAKTAMSESCFYGKSDIVEWLYEISIDEGYPYQYTLENMPEICYNCIHYKEDAIKTEIIMCKMCPEFIHHTKYLYGFLSQIKK